MLQGCIPDAATDKGIEDETNQDNASFKKKKRNRKQLVTDDDDTPLPKPCEPLVPGVDNDLGDGNGNLSDAGSFSANSNRGNLSMFHSQ